MTKFYSGKVQTLIECTSISLGLVLGAIYLDPMAVKTFKNEIQSPLKTISNYNQPHNYQYARSEKIVVPTKVEKSNDEIIVASR